MAKYAWLVWCGWLPLAMLAACDRPNGAVRSDATKAQRLDDSINESVTTIISDTLATCVGCSLVIEKLYSLTVPSDSIFFRNLPIIVQSRAGTTYAYVAGPPFQQIFVYDARGVFLRAIGTRGRGPGEFESLQSVAPGLADSIHVVTSDRQMIVLDDAGRYARETSLSFATPNGHRDIPVLFDVIADGRMVINARVASREYAGVPLFELDVNGNLLRAFGTPTLSSVGSLSFRLLAATSDKQSIWTSESANYRLERFDMDQRDTAARLREVIGVHAPWFGGRPVMTREDAQTRLNNAKRVVIENDTRRKPEYMQREPATLLRGMQTDDEDLLWLVWQVPRAGWDTVSLTYPKADEMQIGTADNDMLWETVLDVVDATSKQLRVRHRFPFHAHLVRPGLLAHSYYDNEGEPTADVWSVVLERSTR